MRRPPKMKITKVKVWTPPNPNPLFNQSDLVVTVETDAGITGIGEGGGSKDLIAQCAGRLIGQDPHYIERLWQDMSRAFFYPPGTGKGACAGRARPGAVGHQRARCSTCRCTRCWAAWSAIIASATTRPAIFRASSRAWASRSARSSPSRRAIARFAWARPIRRPNGTSTRTSELNQLAVDCAQAREGVGKNGDWCVDFHQRFDLSEAVRGCELIQDLAPYFVEDPVRAEAFLEDIPMLRQKVNVPIAAGEEWGNRWDFNKLVESHDIDYVRATLPNVGGITEMMKIAAICETHFVGSCRTSPGPISTAALVNCLGTFSGPVLMEYNYGGRTIPHMPVAWISRMASSIRTTGRAWAWNWI